MSQLSYSIIIPTYNEEKDIRRTIEALIAIDWPRKEMIIVDDSTDRTPEIVKEYANKGVQLIRPDVRRGRCEARNIGVRASSGDVLIVLNADVLLPKDFIDKINKYYLQGYGSVSVMNSISNTEELFARYIEAKKNLRIEQNVYRNWAKDLNGIFWTEGFSVRRDQALKTSLFPSGYGVPIEAGEDARFADELRKVGCKGFFAEEINVPHIAPGTLKEFWHIRVGRGAGTPQIRFYLDKWPHWKIAAWRYTKIVQRIARVALLLPIMYPAYRLARAMKGRIISETLSFSWAIIVEELAKTVGEYRSHKKVKNNELNVKGAVRA